MEDFGIYISHISSLIQECTQEEIKNCEIKRMYSIRIRETDNYCLRESYGKKINLVLRLSESSLSSIRGFRPWDFVEG